VDNGMPHTDVTSVAQDDKGFIWLGTYAGLCRYDGYDIRTYLNKNSQLRRVYHNRINDIAIGKEGLIWLATQSGLAVFDSKKEQFYNFENNSQFISKVATDTEGGVYAVINNQLSAFQLDKNRVLQKIDFENFEDKVQVSAFGKNAQNDLFIATNTEGVLKIKMTGNTRLIERIAIKDQTQNTQKYISAVYFDQNENMVLGSQNGYIFIKKQEWQAGKQDLIGQFVQVAPSTVNLPNDQNFSIIALAADPFSKSVWVATETGMAKLKDWETGQFIQKFTGKTQPSIASDHVSQLFIDKMGCLWVTSYGGTDILDLNGKKFYSFGRDEKNPLKSLSDDYARALLEDDNGNLWVGTRNEGINIINLKTNEWRYLRHIDNSSNSISSNKIRSLTKDKQGRIWIGTDVGIDIVEGNSFKKIKANKGENSLSGAAIFSMGVDVFGQIWAGSWENGLNKVRYQSAQNPQIERIFKGENGLTGNKVSFVFADPQRPEVFVSTTEGLNHIFLNETGDIATIYHYKGIEGNPKTLNSDFVWPLVRTDAKTLWVGTLGGGLNKITLLGDGKYEAKYIKNTEGGLTVLLLKKLSLICSQMRLNIHHLRVQSRLN
jgi:ligand-binding sensor domain-containing protein